MKLFKNMVRSLYKRLWKDEWEKLNKIKCFRKASSYEIDLKQWIDYEQTNDIEEKYNLLKRDLGKKDIDDINLLRQRIELCTNCYVKEYPYYINLDEIYTEEEKIKKEETKKYIQKYKEYFPVDFYEPNVLYEHCGLKLVPFVKDYIQGKGFIDGGACIGDSAFIFEKYYNPGCVYAFEPLKENIEYINKTIEMNNLKHIQPVKSALGDKEEEIELSYNPNDISGTSFIHDNKMSTAKETITITTIDKYVKENNINLGLIKLDVEGYESNVINGAIQSIKQYRPVMLISIYHTPKDFFEIKPLIESLNLNYKFKIRKLSPERLHCETMLICYPAELCKE